MSILASSWKSEACGQTVLPDRPLLIWQKLVENAKIKNSNTRLWVIFKQCEFGLFLGILIKFVICWIMFTLGVLAHHWLHHFVAFYSTKLQRCRLLRLLRGEHKSNVKRNITLEVKWGKCIRIWKQNKVNVCLLFSKIILWKLLKMLQFNFWVLAFSTNFCPAKTYLSGNPVWLQASGFQKLAKMDHFRHF